MRGTWARQGGRVALAGSGSREGVNGLLRDKSRPRTLNRSAPAIIDRALAMTAEHPLRDPRHWTAGLMAKALGISISSVQRI
jgi:hypothetical protein